MSQNLPMDRAMLVKARYEDELLSKPHVIGVALGKTADIGQEYCVVVMVARKLPTSAIAPQDRIPEEIDGVRIAVKVIGLPQAQ